MRTDGDYISREETLKRLCKDVCNVSDCQCDEARCVEWFVIHDVPAADVRPVSEIEKIIESLQEQADIYNARAKELLVEEDGQVSQYTWAVSLRETYRRIIKTLDDLIS